MPGEVMVVGNVSSKFTRVSNMRNHSHCTALHRQGSERICARTVTGAPHDLSLALHYLNSGRFVCPVEVSGPWFLRRLLALAGKSYLR